MVAYTEPQQRKKEESERLRGERDQSMSIDLRFERWKVVSYCLASKSFTCTALKHGCACTLWLKRKCCSCTTHQSTKRRENMCPTFV